MIKKGIFLVGWDDSHTRNLCSLLEKERYRPVLSPSLSDAKARLDKQRGQVLLIDLDQITPDSRSLKELRKEFPGLGLIGLSSRKFHEELEEAMSRYIDACFEKSEDYEDLLYWLKAVFDPSIDRGSRGKGPDHEQGPDR
jgi:DNA-binding NtrC family response regulator